MTVKDNAALPVLTNIYICIAPPKVPSRGWGALGCWSGGLRASLAHDAAQWTASFSDLATSQHRLGSLKKKNKKMPAVRLPGSLMGVSPEKLARERRRSEPGPGGGRTVALTPFCGSLIGASEIRC